MGGLDGPIFALILLCLGIAAGAFGHRASSRRKPEPKTDGPDPAARFRGFFENPLAGCMEVSPDGTVMSVNRTECQLRRMTPDEVVGKYVWDLDPDPVKSRQDFRQRCAGPHDPPPARRTHVHAKGTTVVDTYAIRLRDSAGQAAGFLFISVDRTDAHRAEEEVLRTNAELKAIFDAFPDSFLRLDPAGAILDYKPAVSADFALPVGRFAGKALRELLPPEAGESVARALAEVQRTKMPVSAEFSLPGEGSPKHFEARMSAINWTEALVLVRNVTAKKEAEQRVREYTVELQAKNEELADALISAHEATTLKRRFVANMSHEIRTPINGVVGMMELLLATEPTSEQREYVDAAARSAADLLKVVDGILDLSRIESGRLRVAQKAFDVRKAVKDLLDGHSLEASFKGLALKCEVASDVPFIVRGDPDRLRQVLGNLVDNAIKFTERGQVSVRVSVAGSNGQCTLSFMVEDTGTGIDPALVRRVFETFTQADDSSTRKHRGLGLGLAICKQLVAMMGGEIAVSSTPGSGSRFSFTAVFERQETGAGGEAAQPVGLRNVRVLAAEQDEAERGRLSDLLAYWGCQYHIAPNGQEATRALRTFALEGKSFQVALIAIDMSGESALAVARAVKSDPVIRDTVLIALLPAAMKTEGQALRAIGYASCVQKPLPAADLYDTIAEEIRSIHVPAGEVLSQVPSGPRLVPAPTRPVRRPGARILIAEDDPVNQKISLRLLEKMGLEADAVFDGQKAFEAATENSYDLVLMDLQMPKMDGMEATAAIRFKEGQSRHTPIIAVTANAMPGDRERCLASGMDDYISKPVSLEKLHDAISRWLDVKKPVAQRG